VNDQGGKEREKDRNEGEDQTPSLIGPQLKRKENLLLVREQRKGKKCLQIRGSAGRQQRRRGKRGGGKISVRETWKL